MNKGQIEAITTLIVNALVILNMVLQAKGLPAIEIGSEELSLTVNAVLVVITTVVAWFRNNNITANAQLGQQVVDGLKDGEVSKEQVESLLGNE